MSRPLRFIYLCLSRSISLKHSSNRGSGFSGRSICFRQYRFLRFFCCCRRFCFRQSLCFRYLLRPNLRSFWLNCGCCGCCFSLYSGFSRCFCCFFCCFFCRFSYCFYSTGVLPVTIFSLFPAFIAQFGSGDSVYFTKYLYICRGQDNTSIRLCLVHLFRNLHTAEFEIVSLLFSFYQTVNLCIFIGFASLLFCLPSLCYSLPFGKTFLLLSEHSFPVGLSLFLLNRLFLLCFGLYLCVRLFLPTSSFINLTQTKCGASGVSSTTGLFSASLLCVQLSFGFGIESIGKSNIPTSFLIGDVVEFTVLKNVIPCLLLVCMFSRF